jgi:hypothetical protein
VAAALIWLQIKHCDSILEHMEGLLGKFQADLGQVSEEIRALQVRAAASCGSLTRQMLGGHWCWRMRQIGPAGSADGRWVRGFVLAVGTRC